MERLKPMHPPIFAPIYDVFPSGAESPADISPARLIEPEIMFRVDHDLPARGHNYSVDRELMSVVGCHPFDNPFLPVVVGVNRLRRHDGVQAGEIIVTNSSTSFLPVGAGTRIRAAYEGVGEVTATFAPS